MATRVHAPVLRGRRLPTEWVLDPPQTGARHRLRTVFGRADLVVLGLGVTIGAGIFSLAGQQAAGTAGPAVLVSFCIAAFVCLLSALSYAEMASALPAAGSAYTFTYVSLGEVWAWLVGWAFLLEMLLATAVIARVWSEYALATLDGFGVVLPPALDGYVGTDARVDVLAIATLLGLAVLVVVGGRLSVRVLWGLVLAKVAILLFVIGAGATHVNTANYTPFVPESQPLPVDQSDPTVLQVLLGGSPDAFGVTGVFLAVPVIVFAFLGFDIIATAAEETRHPQRDVPVGILRTVLLTTLLYLGVSGVLLGMQPHTDLGVAAPVSAAFRAVGADRYAQVVEPGALIGLTTVMLVLLIGLTRLAMSMARDGLIPAGLGRVSQRFRSPARAALVVSLATVTLTLAPVLQLAELVSVGSLFAFVFVSLSVIVLRRRRPDLPRLFRVKMVPFLPLLAILSTLWVMLHLHVEAWLYFGFWMAGGLLLYLVYGRRRSRVARLMAPRRGGRHTAVALRDTLDAFDTRAG
ncbi:MAG: APC family permease [Actinomycetes bacterium]